MDNLLYIALLAIDVFVILDIFKRPWETGKKILWTVIVLVLPLLGPILYWFIGRK